ncbi:MAG: hypothetical protein ABI352_11090 [Candidatus Dormibacter sp.]
MNGRITFGAELRHAMQVRGLSLSDVAAIAGVATATASSAAKGRPVNVTTALRVARAVAARPIVPELLEWVERPQPFEVGLNRSNPAPVPSSPSSGHPPTVAKKPANRFPGQRRATGAAGQLRIAVD